MGLSKYIFTLLEDRPNLFYSERVPLHRHTSHYSQNLKLSMYFTLMLFTITKQKKTVNAARPAGFSATVLHWNTFTCKCSSCPTDQSEAERDLQQSSVFIWMCLSGVSPCPPSCLFSESSPLRFRSIVIF